MSLYSTKFGDIKMHSNNDNKLWNFLKKDTSFIIFVLTSIGTILTLIIKGLELTYRYARYTTLNIPLHFLNSGISTKLILSIVFIILTFSVSIFLCIICRSYYEKLKAFWIFDASFHTQKPPKIKRAGINIGFIILFYVVLMFINTPCVLFGVYNITIGSLPFFMIIFSFVCIENMLAEHIIILIDSHQENREWEFKPYNDRDTQKELTREEIEEINSEYMSHKSLMSFSHMKQVISIFIILACIFVITYETGKSSGNNRNAVYQIISISEKPYLVLEKCDNLYIVASITEIHKENKDVLNIEISNQLIVQENGVMSYQIKSFDEINLEK